MIRIGLAILGAVLVLAVMVILAAAVWTFVFSNPED